MSESLPAQRQLGEPRKKEVTIRRSYGPWPFCDADLSDEAFLAAVQIFVYAKHPTALREFVELSRPASQSPKPSTTGGFAMTGPRKTKHPGSWCPPE